MIWAKICYIEYYFYKSGFVSCSYKLFLNIYPVLIYRRPRIPKINYLIDMVAPLNSDLLLEQIENPECGYKSL